MQDEQPKKKPLSEIGHLFLSSVRDQHLGGLPLPQRVPPRGQPQQQPQPPVTPGQADPRVDMTPAEYARVLAACEPAEAGASAGRPVPPVTAVVGEHLNGRQRARVKEYARHLVALTGARVGLIELDASEFRLMCFDGHGHVVEAGRAGARVSHRYLSGSG